MISKIASIIKPRFFAFVTILSFVGVIGLYIFAMSIEPQEVAIGDISFDDIGMVVSTRGYVKDLRISDAVHITLIDIKTLDSILVYAPESTYESMNSRSDLVPGTELKVQGEVKDYNGKLELYVRTSKGFTLLSKPKDLKITIENLAKDPELFKDLNVTVEGQVISIETFYDYSGSIATSMVLKNGSHRLDCISYGVDLSNKVALGSTITFRGTIEYYENSLTWVLVATRDQV